MRFNVSRLIFAVGVVGLSLAAYAQDRWPNMPGYQEMQAGNASGRDWKLSPLRGSWVSNTKYQFEDLTGKKEFDVSTGKTVALNGALDSPMPIPQRQPERGRQWDAVKSADGKKTAIYRDGNVYLQFDGKETAVTTSGNVDRKIKFGTGSWVYGEELNQTDAMGFSPDGRWLWYYGFDDNDVTLYYLTLGQKNQYTNLDIEAFPKPGTGNPKVDLYVYDTKTNQSKKVSVREGDYSNAIGHYVYGISWVTDSTELVFHRMDRRQKERELCAYDPMKNSVRRIDREENQAGWVEFGPVADLEAGRVRQNVEYKPSFMYISEDDGFLNIWRLDIKAGKRTQITKHKADVVNYMGAIGGGLFYQVADGKTPYHQQIYRSRLDGTQAKRLTDPEYAASGSISPDGKFVAVTYQTDSVSPFLRIVDSNGKVVGSPETKAFEAPSEDSRSVRWFSFPSLDGTTTIWGKVHLPSTYQLGQKLPVLFSVYGGPTGWRIGGMRFEKPNGLSEAGFAIVEVFERGGSGRGRAFRQAIYRNLGKYEIDDIAAGAAALKSQSWADPTKVGVYGTSYGGYASAMCLLRYPDLFQAASASSAVTDWRLYDSTYTERYMDLLENNQAGYDAGSCMTYAKDLKGWLMIYFGSADNNVHPSNSFQLSDALRKAGKYHELQAGVDQGHTGLNMARMMEFFTERLILNPKK
ncbi:MAG: DPP IV N-terminal domain-containing protein [Fimbriimonadaceae bacterium]